VSEGDFHQIFAEAIEAGRPNSTLYGLELTTALRTILIDTPNTLFESYIFILSFSRDGLVEDAEGIESG